MINPQTFDGFKRVVVIEDSLILSFGFILGALTMLVLISLIFVKCKSIHSEHFDSVNYVKFTSQDGKKTYFINTKRKNIFEVIRTLLIITLSPTFLSKNYIKRNEKIAKRLAILLVILALIISLFAIWAIVTINMPPELPLKVK